MKKIITTSLFVLILFSLVVNNVQATGGTTSNIQVMPQEIDLGDYQTEMIIGTKQLLNVTVLPIDASQENVVFTSSDEKVASVNGLGRIFANNIGKTLIKAKIGNIEESFWLSVVKEETIDDNIKVTDFELTNFENEVAVGSSISYQVNVKPNNATDKTVLYESSNNNIITVNESGEIKGVSTGGASVTIKVGEISKSYNINVYEPTKTIKVDKSLVVLKPKETYKIEVSVSPNTASQNLTFESGDKNVVDVSSTGVISAKSVGDTIVYINNKDYNTAVSVVVTEDKEDIEDITESTKSVINEIDIEDTENINLNVNSDEIVTKKILKQAYENKTTITIDYEEYVVKIDGKDIVNYNNELSIDVLENILGNQDGFNIKENNFPGKIRISTLKDTYKHFYMYDDNKSEYIEVNNENEKEFVLTTAGEYIITNNSIEKIDTTVIIIIIISGVIMLGLVVVFIIVKKRYWFW